MKDFERSDTKRSSFKEGALSSYSQFRCKVNKDVCQLVAEPERKTPDLLRSQKQDESNSDATKLLEVVLAPSRVVTDIRKQENGTPLSVDRSR